MQDIIFITVCGIVGFVLGAARTLLKGFKRETVPTVQIILTVMPYSIFGVLFGLSYTFFGLSFTLGISLTIVLMMICVNWMSTMKQQALEKAMAYHGCTKSIRTREEFTIALRDAGDKLVVVDFWAQWCTPCLNIAPAFAKLSDEFPDVVFLKVDVDNSGDVAHEARITAMPTFQFYKNQLKTDQFLGASEGKLRSYISKYAK
jgi:thioredoxin